jgi:FMN phosphatase YigB (HAD superfamily)
LLDFFEPKLRLYSHDIGLTKNSPAIFLRAVELAGQSAEPQRCLFVGEDAAERSFATQAGLRVCPDPLLVEELLESADVE